MMKWDGLPIVIFGTGGISKETFHIIQEINDENNSQVFNFLGFIAQSDDQIGNEILNGYRVIASDENFKEFANTFSILAVVIPIGTPKVKSAIYHSIKSLTNIVFPNIIHPTVQYDKNSVLFGYGNIFAAGVKMTCNIDVGNFNLINLNSTIGHDTKIGDFNVINPLSAVSGNVHLKNLSLVGTGAKVLQQLTINNSATVGAGAVVVKDVEEFCTVVGVPAKKIK
jgi:sugar O-acyltransferase (sialic acid O-acetyltransferase NeuD family)